MREETAAFYEQTSPASLEPAPPAPPSIIRIDTSEPAPRRKMVPLFYIGDRQYNIPAEVSAREAHQAMTILADRGSNAANVWMMRTALGPDGYADLLACPQVGDEQMRQIEKVVTDMFLGALRDVGKGSTSGPPSSGG